MTYAWYLARVANTPCPSVEVQTLFPIFCPTKEGGVCGELYRSMEVKQSKADTLVLKTWTTYCVRERTFERCSSEWMPMLIGAEITAATPAIIVEIL